jgi:hypothetical protein
VVKRITTYIVKLLHLFKGSYMATLYITEYAESGHITGPVAVAKEPRIASQTLAIGGGSLASSAFGSATRLVRLHSDAICSIEFGTAPTATTAKSRMAANQTEYFAVPANKDYKVAVISNT